MFLMNDISFKQESLQTQPRSYDQDSGHNHKVEIVNTTPRFPSQETRPKNIAVNYIIRVK